MALLQLVLNGLTTLILFRDGLIFLHSTIKIN